MRGAGPIGSSGTTGRPAGTAFVALCRRRAGAAIERIPKDERNQLLAHLPSDVRELASEPRREGDAVTRLRTVAELVTAVAARDGMSPERAQAITESVLAHLRRLVPEEVEDVAAVLPEELRQLWTTAVPG